ncbi:MAG TPA: ImmA/IrrE family metallo-endopeptidase [Gemmataceae bacterium]|nr:ImmA/IrrE family metallo-endopeptidase [Gemmataceae bacterium]
MREDLTREEVAETVDRAVEELLKRAGLEGPPVDAIALAQRHLGMIVCLDRRQPQRGRAQRAGGRKQIFLRPEPTEERHQWTVAHEIGEHLKADLLRRLGIDPEQTRAMMGESLANLLAHRLLVPTCWFATDAPAFDYDLLALKKRYRTASHEVIAWRFLDLPAPCIVTVVDNDRVHRRRSNAWQTRRELAPAERECQRYVNHHGRPHVVRKDGWTVQGWPIHQPDWKREILRSVVEEE